MAGEYSEEHVTRPIFKPLRDKFRVFGVPVMKFFLILGVGIACVGIAAGTGAWQHTVTQSYTSAELQTLKSEYSSTLTALASIEAQRQRAGASSYSELSLSNDQKETIAKAKELGITATMTSSEAEALVPTSHSASVPVIPDAVRYFVIVGFPVIAMFALFMEMNRTSLYKELKRTWRGINSQKVYKSRPIEYVERVTGESYWAALPAAANLDEALER